MIDFSDRVLLLTGAGGGIGSSIARTFLDLGARVLLADANAEGVRALAAELDSSGSRAVAKDFDASSPDDAGAVVAECIARFERLDYLVPAAAIYEEQSFVDMSDEQWRKTLATNLDGVFYICRRAIPVMADSGAIVTVASQAAHEGSSIGHAHYGASKGGILALTRSLARELAPRIRVNAVSPGTIDTPMVAELLRQKGPELLATTPFQRFGRPEEIAATVAFLCSDAASYITGEAVHVNGGSYMSG